MPTETTTIPNCITLPNNFLSIEVYAGGGLFLLRQDADFVALYREEGRLLRDALNLLLGE